MTQLNNEEGIIMTEVLFINELYPVCKNFELADLRKKYWKVIRELKREKVKKLISDNISKSPSIRFGKPVIKGTRIAVEDIVKLVYAGYSDREIIKEFNHRINKEQITYALAYDFSKLGKVKTFLNLYLGINWI